MTKILTIGNALVDIMTILNDDQMLDNLNIPKASMQLVDFNTSNNILKKIKGLKQEISLGGSAANTARGLAMLDADITYIGKVGDDEFGRFFAENTKKEGVKPVLIQSGTPTGTAIAMVSKDSERTFATYLGAAAELETSDITKELFQNFDMLHIEGYLIFNHELMEKILITAKDCGIKVSIDLASYNVVEANLKFLKEFIVKYVDIVFANEEEAKALTGLEPEDAVKKISEYSEIAIVKVGSKGSYIIKQGELVKQEACKANPIDTTGAGDYYAAGFLYGLTRSYDISKCAKIGSILAANVIEIIGTKIDEKHRKIIREQV